MKLYNPSFDKLQQKATFQKTTLENVLREELQKCVLFLLSEESFFEMGVFQGGTALRIVYNNIRYSEDLDFVYTASNSTMWDKTESIIQKIPKKMQKWFPYLRVSNGKWQKRDTVLKRFQFSFKGSSISSLMLQLEFANIPSYSTRVVPISFDVVTFPIRVETQEEILMDKIVALGLRNYLKGRDIWDLYYILFTNHVSVSQKQLLQIIQQKSGDYGFSITDFVDKFSVALEKLKQDGVVILEMEMKRFMDSRVFSIYDDQFSSIVRDVVNYLNPLNTYLHEHRNISYSF